MELNLPPAALWKQAVAALAAGAASVLAFAPFGAWPLAPVALALLFLLWNEASPRRAFVIGWAFGMGLFSFGLFWVRISISVYGGAPEAFAVAAALALAAFMAAFHGLAGALAARLTRPGTWQRAAFAAPAAWTLLEWVRGWLFTGFPWLQLGYSQIDGPLAGLAPLGGVLGVTLGVALVAGWAAALAVRGAPRALAISLGLLVLGSLLARDHSWTHPDGEPIRVTLIQGNVAQEDKWAVDSLYPTAEIYLELTGDRQNSDLIIWPEAALPAFADEIEDTLLTPIQDWAREHGNTVLLGALFRDPDDEHYFTSMLSLNEDRDRYDKRHLVPFGEYFPLGFLWKDAVRGLATMSEDFTAGDADKPLLDAGPWPVGGSICYEILFGEEVRQAMPEARMLVNVSNDGWFGDSLGPHQHLEIARMRALENGRELLRATNTGITAVVGPDGRVRERLPQFERGALETEVQPRAGLTPYSRWGGLPVIVLSLLLAIQTRRAS